MKGQASRPIGLMLLACAISLSALGQLFMKVGMQALHAVGGSPVSMSLSALHAPILWTVAGLSSYFISLLAWLAVLVRYPLSFAYPLVSLSYVLVYLGATHWPGLMEQATPLRTAGILLILAGVALVSLTRQQDSNAANPD